MSGKTKAELQVALEEAEDRIDELRSTVYAARRARQIVQSKVSNLAWEEAQTKAKGDAYEDTKNRFQKVLNDWPKE